MATSSLKNVNLLSKAQYDAQENPATDELWALDIDTDTDLKKKIIGWGSPDYNSAFQIAWNAEHVATVNGVVTFNAFCDGSNHTVYVNINGKELFLTDDNKGIGPGWTGGSHQAYFGMFFMVSKGDTYKVYGGSGHQMMYFYPMKGEAE